MNIISIVSKTILGFAFLSLLGCQTNKPENCAMSRYRCQIDEAIENNYCVDSKGECLPDAINQALMPNMLSRKACDVNSAERRFDIFVEDVPAKTFFLGLVKDTPYNISVAPDIEGRISLQLKKVTIPQILETVRSTYGYDFKRYCDVFEILPRTKQTRAFKINYLNMNRDGRSEIRVSAGGLKSSAGVIGTGVAAALTTEAGGAQVINTKIITKSQSDFWDELEKTIFAMVVKEGGTVKVSPMAGTVVVTAFPKELRKVEQYLVRAEANLNKQVILEAKIIEVELNDSFQAGINWELLSGRLRATQFGGQVISGEQVVEGTFPILNEKLADNSFDNPLFSNTQVTTPNGTTINSTTAGLNPITGVNQALTTVTNPITGASTVIDNVVAMLPGKPPGRTFNSGQDVGTFGGVFTLAMNYKNIAQFVELLGAQGRVHVLSSPRISTMNNQKALIKVGRDQFFITNISTTTTAIGTSATTTPSVQFDPFFSGIALDVTPSINECDEVTLHIHPAISNVRDERKNFTLNGTVQSIPLAASTVRESDSMVKAKSGQTVIIGGLMQDNKGVLREGIPFLMDLPVIGNWFTHTLEKKKKSELVILLRPIIVHPHVWTKVLEDTADRYEALDLGCRP